MPTTLRLLLAVMRLKTNSERKDHLANLHKFNTQVLTMVSNASQLVFGVDNSKMATYAMITFLRCPELAVSMDNFRLIIHVFCILEVNAFGISEKSMLRAGTGVYSPSNLFNHSCNPNCICIYRGRTQFTITIRDVRTSTMVSKMLIRGASSSVKVTTSSVSVHDVSRMLRPKRLPKMGALKIECKSNMVVCMLDNWVMF
jgi:hypothetical protein